MLRVVRHRRSFSRKARQAAPGRDGDAARRQPVQQGFARAAAGRPRLYEAGPLGRAQTARPARAAADDLLRCRYRLDPYLDRIGPVTYRSPPLLGPRRLQTLGRNALRFRLPGLVDLGRRPIPGSHSIFTPALTLRLGNPGATSLGLRARGQSTVEAAARPSELDPHQASPACTGFRAAPRPVLALGLPSGSV
jgi:hypothetical protein